MKTCSAIKTRKRGSWSLQQLHSVSVPCFLAWLQSQSHSDGVSLLCVSTKLWAHQGEQLVLVLSDCSWVDALSRPVERMSKWRKGRAGRSAPAPSHSPAWNQGPDAQDLPFVTSCSRPKSDAILSQSLWQLCHLRNRTVFPLNSSRYWRPVHHAGPGHRCLSCPSAIGTFRTPASLTSQL